jgi:hypothetical protein
MVVRFVCAVRVPLCVCVSRVCPGSPRCLFTGCFYRERQRALENGHRDPCGRGRARLERRILTLVTKNVIRTDQHGSMQTAALHSPDIRHLSLYMYILKHVLACPRKRESGESIYEIVGNVAATRGVSSEV